MKTITSSRKWLFIMAVCFYLIPMYSQTVSINLSLQGSTKRDTINLLWGATHKGGSPFHTRETNKNTTLFTFEIDQPRLVQIEISGYSERYELLVSPGDRIQVKGKIKNELTSKNKFGSFVKVKVKGCKLQADFEHKVRAYTQITNQIDKVLNEEYGYIIKQLEAAHTQNDSDKIKQIYETPEGKAYTKKVIQAFQLRKEALDTLITPNLNSFWGPMLMLKFGGRLSDWSRLYYDRMSDEAKNSVYGKEVKEEVYPSSLIGQHAPDFTIETTQGETKRLMFPQTDCIYTLVDFWASWCGPCIQEIPNLKKIYSHYEAKGLKIISISCDKNKYDWLDALKKEKLPWINYLDIRKEGINYYKVRYIPSIYIIDRNGKIVAENLRGKALAEKIEELMK